MNLGRNGQTNTGCDCLNLYHGREAHLPHSADCEAESPLLTFGCGLGRLSTCSGKEGVACANPVLWKV